MKKSFADILNGLDERRDRKLATKLPEWAGTAGLQIPSSLSLEQCSSTAAALYKANLLKKLNVRTVCDITGGLGVDSWAFSQVAQKVYYNERDAALAQAVEHNYKLLNISNVEISNKCIDATSDLPSCDAFFADPARRSGTGNKVFLLEDCTPDILQLIPHLWERTRTILLKLSPMADITMLTTRLGHECTEVHVIGLDGECKELLCLLQKDADAPCRITVSSLDTGGSLTFLPEEERDAAPQYALPTPGTLLFEPSAALMKAGCFRLLCSRFGLKKLSPSTNLYTCNTVPADIAPLGKTFSILETLPFGNATIRETGRRYPRAEVTARNIPLSSEDLKKKLGVQSGGEIHIFGCTAIESRYLITCQQTKY